MEQEANALLQRGRWVKAAELFTKLLLNEHLETSTKVFYLLKRSECYLQMAEFGSVLVDSRLVIGLLDKTDASDIAASTARSNVVQALFLLKRFSEAEFALREWLTLLDKSAEAPKLLERLHLAMHGAQKTTLLRNELSTLVNHFKKSNYMQRCVYCNLTFCDRNSFCEHCQTEDHQRIIISDEGRDWFWRPPPRGVDVQKYVMCKRWFEKQTCRLGNSCLDAHGIDELNEWIERFKYRQMRMQQAYKEQLFGKSYTQKFLEKLKSTPKSCKVMKDKITGVKDFCCCGLTTPVSKSMTKRWTFTLISHKLLLAVTLLNDINRAYFEIEQIIAEIQQEKITFEISNKQEWLYNKYNIITTDVKYIVKVKFYADVYGTFRQTVIFDFGADPVLCKNVCADVVPAEQAQEIDKIKQEISVLLKDNWTNENTEIISFTTSDIYYNQSYENEFEWTKLYPCPKAGELELTSDIFTGKLSRNNYRERMHTLLYMEEIARREQIGKYNIKANLHIVQSYMLATSIPNSVAKYSNFGELYAFINLNHNISEDTSWGRLILNNCNSVLLSVNELKVYEALIEDKGKNTLYLRLSATTVEALQLKADTNITAQLQFQLNRLPYCEWHYATDKLADLKVIFPDKYIEPLIPWSPEKQWSIKLDLRLNVKQKEALIAITTPTSVSLPPILLIGPFGTGKTFTFAQSIRELIKQENTKILICTHSNSAADIYIKDYLHEYFRNGNLAAKPLRIYYQKRWVYSVHPIVQKYCLIKEENNSKAFQSPTFEDVENHRIIVVTLSTAMYLCNLGLPQGYFTHILLDEAAQALECEAIMPFFLATSNTRIVLAGDHMQLSPEVYSKFVRKQGFHVSLLERLYDHYPATFPCKILLSENYRAHEAIIDFTSEMFYEQKLIASGKQVKHPFLYPLTFFTVKGEDIQDVNSTAFYNNSEAYEIVERVCDLKKNWPKSWGEFNDLSIGILAPYSDQVFRIRSELRKRRLGFISVERVLNVQGKQFRAVFISIVRTQRTCSDDAKRCSDYGFLSNTKLLNTAITRAQSLVAVVGEPITLCTVGRCSKIWEKFLNICAQNCSLFGITWSDLKYQLEGLELKKLYGLNPLAPEFIPQCYQRVHNNSKQGYMFVEVPAHPNPFALQTAYRYVRPPHLALPQIPPPFPPQIPPPFPPQIPPYFSPQLQFPSPPQFQAQPKFCAPPLPPPLRTIYVAPAPPPIQTAPPPIQTAPPTPPATPPNVQASRQATQNDKCLTAKTNNSSVYSQTPPDCNMIQFLDKVHITENGHSLHDLMSLLPKNMSLANVLMQPTLFHTQWYNQLLTNKGIEAAKRFKYLISVATHKPNNDVDSLEMAGPDFDDVLNLPYLDQQSPNLHSYSDPINQINFDKPVYHIPNIRGHEVLQLDADINNQIIERESTPLYQRQSVLNELD